MDTRAILGSLRQEQQRINKAIEALQALEGPAPPPGRPAAKAAAPRSSGQPIRRRKPLTAAAKNHLSEMMKKRWAERKRKKG